ncbi:monocarboxylate transporter 12-like isoform X2 [Homarus americanus]|uniref:monocarboxylate transporter 12-like isoform X2 n=1 Tax=Homarus americanus TaxID=6706 RepID=UPI001C494C9C|nr:monocarboxylate transporter 12-like isoform X2 [Homarus americanus]
MDDGTHDGLPRNPGSDVGTADGDGGPSVVFCVWRSVSRPGPPASPACHLRLPPGRHCGWPRRCASCGQGSSLLASHRFLPPYVSSFCIQGVGLAMSETPGFIVISQYFEKRRATANGLRSAGNPFGGVVFPFIVVFLSREFSLWGILMLLCGIMLQICVMGMLLRPFYVHQRIVERDYYRSSSLNAHEHQSRDSGQVKKIIEKNNSASKKKPLELSYLKNPVYLVYLVMIMCTCAGLSNVFYYLILFSLSIGLSETDVSFIVAFLSVLDMFARMVIGRIGDTKIIKKRHMFILGQILAGVSLFLVSSTKSFWPLVSVVWIHSVGVAAFWALISTLLADQFGEDSLATTWGFFRMTQGVFSFVYPSLLGLVADVVGWMGAPLIFMGSMYCMGGLVFALQPLIVRVSGIKVNQT